MAEPTSSNRRSRAKSSVRSTLDKARSNLPEASTRNIAIGAAAAVTAVGVGVAATVGRERIVKASGDLVATVKKRVESARSAKSDRNGAESRSTAMPA